MRFARLLEASSLALLAMVLLLANHPCGRNVPFGLLHLGPEYAETDEADACLARGLELKKRAQPERAATFFARAVRLQPLWLEPRLLWAEALAETGLVPQAWEQLEVARKLGPLNDEVHFRRGLFLLRYGRPAEAVVSLQTALEAAPDRADARLALERARKAAQSRQPPAPGKW